MIRSAVVFDTDEPRGMRVVDALKARDASRQIAVSYVTDPVRLTQVITEGEVEIVFCDVRSNVGDHNMATLLAQATPTGSKIQIVYMGVSEQNLVALEYGDYAFLLPPNASKHEIAFALDRALSKYEKQLEKPLIVKTRQRVRVIHPRRVSFIESALRKVRIHTGDEVVETYAKLSNITRELPRGFVQCHKSFVVNMGFVEEITKGHLVLASGERIPISQSRRKEVRESLANDLGRLL